MSVNDFPLVPEYSIQATGRLNDDLAYFHGVLVRVNDIGVLIAGDPGVGKSSLALYLLRRGHRLIADDAVEVFMDSPGSFRGRCPDTIVGLLHSRVEGFCDVAKTYGKKAVMQKTTIDCIAVIGDDAGVFRACSRSSLLTRLWLSVPRYALDHLRDPALHVSTIETLVLLGGDFSPTKMEKRS